MKLHKDVGIDSGKEMATCLLLATFAATIGESIVFPALLIEEVILLHSTLAVGSLLVMAKCYSESFSNFFFSFKDKARHAIEDERIVKLEEVVEESLVEHGINNIKLG